MAAMLIFIAALSIIDKNWNNPNIHQLVNRQIMVYSYYSTIKMNRILTLATAWMNLKTIMLSERSQTQKVYIIWFYLYIMAIRSQSTRTENKQVITKSYRKEGKRSDC